MEKTQTMADDMRGILLRAGVPAPDAANIASWLGIERAWPVPFYGGIPEGETLVIAANMLGSGGSADGARKRVGGTVTIYRDEATGLYAAEMHVNYCRTNPVAADHGIGTGARRRRLASHEIVGELDHDRKSLLGFAAPLPARAA